MKERWPTLGLAAAALLLFYALFFPKPVPESDQPALPVSTEDGPDGLAGAWRWLNMNGIAVVSLRQRYEQLERLPGAPAQGNVLISSVPPRLPMRAAEERELEHWMERGNTLVLLAALDDTPRWAPGGTDPEWLASLQRLSNVYFDIGKSSPHDTLASLARPQALLIRPRGRHPLMAGVASLQIVSDLPATRWHGRAAAGSAALAIAERSDDGTPVLWVEPRGAGQLILLAVAGPFNNRQIQSGDNARLLANIIGWSRAARGRVIFDDAHQGLVSFYDPKALYADPRLHRTLAWIVLMWLVWVLGAQALRSRQSPWRPLDEMALIDAAGRFYSVSVPVHEAARRLLANFFNDIRRRLHQPESDAPLWEWLAAQPGILRAQVAELQHWYARSAKGRHVDLIRLQNLLSQLRGEMG